MSLVSESDGKWAPLPDSVDYEDQQHSTASVEQEYPTMINSFAGYGYQPQPNDFAEQYPGAFTASAGHEHQSQPNNSGGQGQGQGQYLAVSTSFAGYGQQPQSNNFARQYPGAFTASTGHGYQSQPNNLIRGEYQKPATNEPSFYPSIDAALDEKAHIYSTAKTGSWYLVRWEGDSGSCWVQVADIPIDWIDLIYRQKPKEERGKESSYDTVFP